MALDDLNDEPAIQDLLRGLEAGDGRSIAELFAHYRPQLAQMLRIRMPAALSARVDPSDVLQEVYLDVTRQIRSWVSNRKVTFYVWLRTLTWERLAKLQRRHLQAQRRTVFREITLPLESSVDLACQLIAQQSSPSQALLHNELRRRVQSAIASLEDEDREVILMRDFEGMANHDVAQVLGISASGATRRYGRAIFRLKQILDSGSATEGSWS
jgi:RNA polymerase sigma-70 factor (ECF subfamily)